ncbi:MAG: SRPBCC family protein [Methyloversatilis sp.]|jgi:mxaD protein|nr:SRPBCC family protein [Methyloversatilis sp.]
MKATLSMLSFALIAPLAQAHGPTPQKIDESVTIAAPPDKVWAVVGDFAGIAGWNPSIAESSADKGNDAGSTRTLKLDKGSVTEQLDDYDAAGMTMNYRSGDANPAVLPVSSYSGRLTVKAEGSGSKLSWQARGYRADTGNEPPPGMDDESAVKALRALMRPGLDAVKAKLEAGGKP